MGNITTTFMGLTLSSPLVASASPLCDSAESISRLEEVGIAGVVLPSLFEEQLMFKGRGDDDAGGEAHCSYESPRFLPNIQNPVLGPDSYLELIRDVKARVSIPIIASLNGVVPGEWLEFAGLMQQAGADAIELNIHSVVTEVTQSTEEVERNYLEFVSQVKQSASVPVAVKLSPFFSAPINISHRLTKAGADALVLFNQPYRPDFDVEHQDVNPSPLLSSSEELLARLHWVAILYSRVAADFGISGGVHNVDDIVKCIMAGARVAFVSSALLRNGVQHVSRMLSGLNTWLDEHHYNSIEEMRGSMSYFD
ncbi:MAG: dihydroorotate dehydrogenase-like protein [Rhodoplanes sp.]